MANSCGGAIANRERILRDLTDIIGICSPSLKEREMAEMLKCKLTEIGFTVYEDDAGDKVGGECGNIIASLSGDDGALPTIAMLAHMDTVNPCENKKWVMDGDIIRSGGDTILGGDDGAGIAAALEIARRVREEGIAHGGILIIFTISEETGLLGAKYLNHDTVKSASGKGSLPDYCLVFDSGTPVGTVVTRAPSHIDIKVEIKGVAAHAGIEPEKGVNAITVASHAIAAMPLGRIDAETTANIGVISGGLARNIVCESVVIKGEARSHDAAKLDKQVEKMRLCFAEACERFNAKLNFTATSKYESFSLSPDEPVIALLSEAAKARGYGLSLVSTGGGSDANVLNSIGIPTANLPVGMHNAHSTNEYADLGELSATVELVVEMFKLLR